jgi:glutamate dehydrogenase/leucine dehydrogenase
LEWKQNKSGEHWDEGRVNDELERIMVAAMHAAADRAEREHINLKEAAFVTAIERLIKQGES